MQQEDGVKAGRPSTAAHSNICKTSRIGKASCQRLAAFARLLCVGRWKMRAESPFHLHLCIANTDFLAGALLLSMALALPFMAAVGTCLRLVHRVLTSPMCLSQWTCWLQ